MNCSDINELSPLWHSGELESSRQSSFEAHLAQCPECAAAMREQWANDVRLRESFAAEAERNSFAARHLERRVVDQIAMQRRRGWLVAGLTTAAAVAAGVLLWISPWRVPAVPPAVFADAARDHTVEIIRKAPRHWRTSPADIAALETAQGISDADVKALEATGYRLERAKICRLGVTPYMHLVYVKGDREFSVFLRARGAQSVPEVASSAGNLQLASFARGKVQAVIVTDAPAGECARFAHEAAAAL